MTYKSTVTIVFDDEESYVDVLVTFTVTPAFSGSSVEPPHEAGVEIQKWELKVGELKDKAWIDAYLERTPEVHDQLLRDAAEDDVAARDDFLDMKRREAREGIL